MAVSKRTHRPTPRANPKKKTRSKPDMEPDAPELPIPPDSSIHFPDVIGKTVARLYYVNDVPEDWLSLEVGFTDGTSFSFRLMQRVYVRACYGKMRSDDVETIREYGIIQCNPPGDGGG